MNLLSFPFKISVGSISKRDELVIVLSSYKVSNSKINKITSLMGINGNVSEETVIVPRSCATYQVQLFVQKPYKVYLAQSLRTLR